MGNGASARRVLGSYNQNLTKKSKYCQASDTIEIGEDDISNIQSTGVLDLTRGNNNRTLSFKEIAWDQIFLSNIINSLQTIDISGISLENMPIEIVSCKSLCRLKASGCGMQILLSLEDLSSLHTIELDGNKLSSSAQLFFPQSTTHLDLSYNHFESLPPSLRQLPQLSILNLKENKISSLEGIGDLISLEILSLDNNLVRYLPNEITNLYNLMELSIKRNRMQVKSDYENMLQSVPKDLFLSPNLEYLCVDGNLDLSINEYIKFDGYEQFTRRRNSLYAQGKLLKYLERESIVYIM